jgi:hypothetical protein
MITSKKTSICHRESAERFRMYVSIAKGTDTREMYSRLMAQEIALAEWLGQRERENASQQLSVPTEGDEAPRTGGEKSLSRRRPVGR